MAKYREYRRIYGYKVRELCIQDNLYTEGTNEEYSHLLITLCKDDADQTLDSLEVIAEDIIKHSDLENLLNRFGCDKEELQKSIMWELINECCITYLERV